MEKNKYPDPCWIITDRSGEQILGRPGPVLGDLYVFSNSKKAEEVIATKKLLGAVPKRMGINKLFKEFSHRFDFFVLDP